jgi:peptidoglycan/LPS O-acetylase OafA/YrhL
MAFCELDTRDTAVIKGLAISAIVLHNFFHVVSPVRENEFTFDPARFSLFLETVRQPALAIQSFFSFFGHFGVQAFIFISAFGLAKSHWDSPARWTTFMAGRVRKMFPIFGVIVLLWAFARAIQLGPAFFLKKMGLELVLMFVGLSPFLPGHGLPPIGPWWFVPFIIQFYAIWPLLRKLTMKFGWPGLLVLSVLCIAITWVADPVLAPWKINLLETPIGRMPNICFGILAARYAFRIKVPAAMAAAAILLLGAKYAVLWPFTFLAALIVGLWIYMALRQTLRGSRGLAMIGYYSALIFMVNGIVRNMFAPLATSPVSQLCLGCATAAVSFEIAVLIQELLFSRKQPEECALRARTGGETPAAETASQLETA